MAEQQDVHLCETIIKMRNYAQLQSAEKRDPKALSGEQRKWLAAIETAVGLQATSDWDGVG